uniref:long-chain-fatty-acid--CoA ligase n=1 Tax=Mesocestoides corti TaxID=53468 RepID=A0A5K3ENB2_MESCO
MAKNTSNSDSYKPSIQNYSYTLEGNIHVNPSFKDCVLPNILGDGSTCVHDLFKQAMELGGDRPFLGTHSTPSAPYVWRSFKEVYASVKKFGSGLRTFQTISSRPFCCIGVYGKNRPEWLITQYACFSYKLVTVPLFDTLGEEALLYICNQAELSVVVCDTAAQALKLLSLAETVPFVKHLIIMNNNDDLSALKEKAGEAIQVLTFEDVIALGEKTPLETMPSNPDDLALVCYTSGTTGLPKGVVVSNRMMLASLNNNILNSGKGHLFVVRNTKQLGHIIRSEVESRFIVVQNRTKKVVLMAERSVFTEILFCYNRSDIVMFWSLPNKLAKTFGAIEPPLFLKITKVVRVTREI